MKGGGSRQGMLTNSLIEALGNETAMTKPNETSRRTHRGEALEEMGLKMINPAVR